MKIKLIIILSILIIPIAFAINPTKLKMRDGNISLLLPEKWEIAKGLFGVQIMLLGPKVSENRPVITIDSTNFKDMKFDTLSLKNNEKDYKDGRENWLKKYNGHALEFFSYQTTSLSSKIIDHNIGFRYELGTNEFVERSHYITCGQNLYHIKTLMRTKEESSHQNKIEEMVKSFNCQ